VKSNLNIVSAFSEVLTGFGVTDGMPTEVVDMVRDLQGMLEFFVGMDPYVAPFNTCE
jgi:hypothetical protein